MFQESPTIEDRSILGQGTLGIPAWVLRRIAPSNLNEDGS